MKHADKFYESQLNTINEKLVKMGSLLEKQFSSALVVLHSRDEQLAQKVERFAKKSMSDGITTDDAGNIYISDLNFMIHEKSV